MSGRKTVKIISSDCVKESLEITRHFDHSPLCGRPIDDINDDTANASQLNEINGQSTEAKLHKEEVTETRKYLMPKFLQNRPTIDNNTDDVNDSKCCLGIETIIPNICFAFLNDECVERSKCLYSHKFPSSIDVLVSLDNIGIDNTIKLFRSIVLRCRLLLNNYFMTFVRFYGRKKHCDCIMEMIEICLTPSFNLIHEFDDIINVLKDSMNFTWNEIAFLIFNRQNIMKNVASLNIVFASDFVQRADVDNFINLIEQLIANNSYEWNHPMVGCLMNYCKMHRDPRLYNVTCRTLECLNKDDRNILSHINAGDFSDFLKKFNEIIEFTKKK